MNYYIPQQESNIGLIIAIVIFIVSITAIGIGLLIYFEPWKKDKEPEPIGEINMIVTEMYTLDQFNKVVESTLRGLTPNTTQMRIRTSDIVSNNEVRFDHFNEYTIDDETLHADLSTTVRFIIGDNNPIVDKVVKSENELVTAVIYKYPYEEFLPEALPILKTITQNTTNVQIETTTKKNPDSVLYQHLNTYTLGSDTLTRRFRTILQFQDTFNGPKYADTTYNEPILEGSITSSYTKQELEDVAMPYLKKARTWPTIPESTSVIIMNQEIVDQYSVIYIHINTFIEDNVPKQKKLQTRIRFKVDNDTLGVQSIGGSTELEL